MNTIKERFKNINIFELMEVRSSPLTLHIFNVIDIEPLNNLFLTVYGNKQCSDICNLLDENIADILLAKYYEKWERLYDEINDKLPLNNVVENYTENSKANLNNNITENNTTNNNKSGYNSDTMLPDDETVEKNNTINTHENSNEKSYTKTVKKASDIYLKKYRIDFLQKMNICDIIITDINTVLCLPIYIDEN